MNKQEYQSLRFHEVVEDSRSSLLDKYRQLVVGEKGYGYLLRYELLQLFMSNIPGSLGIFLRQYLYRFLFQALAKKVVIGRNVCLRQPAKIRIGAGSVVDDYARLTVAGSSEAAIVMGSNVLLGPFSVCSSRDATIDIGDHTSIGSHCRIASMGGRLQIGQHVLIGAYSYIGGGNHSMQDVSVPMSRQSFNSKGGVDIGDDVWIGGHVVVLDGTRIGTGAVVGACSLVTKDIPPYAIAFGVPARVQGSRAGHLAADEHSVE